MNPKARWNALAHRLIGDISALESQLDLVLALTDARDEAAFVRLLSVYSRLSVQERVDLLAGLELPDDETAQHVAQWVRKLVVMRNRLAHSWVVEATQSRAEFSSIYRGRLTKLTVFDDEMARAFRMVRESERSLRYLADVVGDPHLWGRLMGFDEH